MSFFFGPGMGGGGFSGMGGGGADDGSNSESEAGANTTKYYEILGCDKNATQNQIKKKYRKLARELHPDKHPDEQDKYQAKFQELQKAYETLSDPQKRKLYDRYGEQGLKGSSGFGGGHGDIFDMFFGGRGGGGGGGGQRRRKKAPSIRQFLDVTLEDLYIGSSKVIEYEKMTLCDGCGGKGGSKVVECSSCNGNGVQIIMKRMGYMTVQTQRECPSCRGEGTTIPDGLKCKKCTGKGLKKVKKKIDFIIPRGSKHAEKILLNGQGHEIPDAANGDVVIILRCIKHDKYQRIGADLAMNYKVSLKQALCGFTIYINHLSGYKLKVQSSPYEIISHGQLKAIYSKGMPQKGSNNTYGHLYVKFEIVFPDKLDVNTRKILRKLLPKGEYERDIEEYEKEEKEKEKQRQIKFAKLKAKNQAKKNNTMDVDNDNDNNNNDNNNNNNDDYDYDDDDDFELHETAENVTGEPKVTPASARSAYDEDEEDNDGVSCRQM